MTRALQYDGFQNVNTSLESTLTTDDNNEIGYIVGVDSEWTASMKN